MPALPTTTREVHLTTIPTGLPEPHHLDVVETGLPTPDAHHALIRTTAFLITPAMLMTLVTGRIPGLALRPGDVLPGPAVGEVLTAPPGSDLAVGTLVAHPGGWREHAVVPLTDLRRLDPDILPVHAHLSQGWPAWVALTRVAPVHDGDTVFVSGGAGALGSLAGQIARLLGAGRVVGSTGSPDKAHRMVTELGYDAAVLRGPRFRDDLAAAAPSGLDVVVDTVGGTQLEAAVTLARPHARFALLGATSGQLAADPTALTRPVALDPVALVTRRLTLRGMDAGEHPDALTEWESRFGAWLRDGAITFPHVVVDGIDAAPAALRATIDGHHLGSVLVRPRDARGDGRTQHADR